MVTERNMSGDGHPPASSRRPPPPYGAVGADSGGRPAPFRPVRAGCTGPYAARHRLRLGVGGAPRSTDRAAELDSPCTPVPAASSRAVRRPHAPGFRAAARRRDAAVHRGRAVPRSPYATSAVSPGRAARARGETRHSHPPAAREPVSWSTCARREREGSGAPRPRVAATSGSRFSRVVCRPCAGARPL